MAEEITLEQFIAREKRRLTEIKKVKVWDLNEKIEQELNIERQKQIIKYLVELSEKEDYFEARRLERQATLKTVQSSLLRSAKNIDSKGQRYVLWNDVIKVIDSLTEVDDGYSRNKNC